MAKRRVRVKKDENSKGSEFDKVVAKAKKDYGSEVISVANNIAQPHRIPTGIFLLDFALLGGVPFNRVIHIIGERSAGKSMLSDKIAAGAQQMLPEQSIVKIDVEGTHDSVWSEKLGVDLDRLHVVQPETGEIAVDLADAFIGTKEVSVVIIDSIAALVPMKEVDDSAEDQHVGLQAKLVSRMVRKVTAGMIRERQRGHYVTIVLVNQFRSKIGGMIFGDPRSIPGGKALEFSATVQLVMKNKEQIGRDEFDAESVVRNSHVFQIQKNKISAGLRAGEFDLLRVPDDDLGLKEGDVDDAETILTYAKKFGVFTGGGSSWVLEFWDYRVEVRGMRDAVEKLYADPAMKHELCNYLIYTKAASLDMPEDFLNRFLV